MLIKITGRDQNHLDDIITRVMNLACVAFRRGSLPSERDIKEAEKTGQYWYINTKENKFELLPSLNNHKAFIVDSGEKFITIRFHSRYDMDNKEVDALSNLIIALFSPSEVQELS